MSWESISLSDALRPLKSSPFTRDELNYSGGQYQNVHYGDILVRFPSVVDAEKEGLPYVSDSAEGRCSRCSLLQNGDIIIADTAEDEAVGKAIEIQGITDQKVVSGLHTMAFRPQEGLFAPGFLGYFLNSSVYHNQLLPLMQGIKVLSISKTAIGDTVIKYPSYKEQEKIVESLSGVDDMIGVLDEAIAKKQQIKEGLMQQLLTGKTRLPGFRGEWDEVTFKSIYKYAKEGGTPSTGVAEYYNPATVPFAKIEDLKDKYLTRVESYISESGVEHSSAWVIPVDSVILSNGATLGEVSINKIPTSTKQGILGIILKEQYSPEFVYYLFKGRVFRREMERVTTHGTMDCAYLKDLNTIPLTMPSLKEQEAIASVISSIDKEVYSLESLRDKYSLIKQGMMQELLTGTIRLI